MCEVPDTPAAATLDVVGSNSVEVSLEPPISDGGSPLTSFTVSSKSSLLLGKTLSLICLPRMLPG